MVLSNCAVCDSKNWDLRISNEWNDKQVFIDRRQIHAWNAFKTAQINVYYSGTIQE